MKVLTPTPILGLPHSGPIDRESRHLATAFSGTPTRMIPADERRPNLSANYFGLDNSRLFVAMTPSQQSEVLHRCGVGLLYEALHIEECGMAFGAKMALSAQTVHERMLFSVVSADEAKHYQMIRRWLPDYGQDSVPDVFHTLLKTAISEGQPTPLVGLVQVVLEGWGLRHYAELAKATANSALRAELMMILKDEARHHQLGVTLVRATARTTKEDDWLLDQFVALTRLIAAGPVAVVHHVGDVAGGLTPSQITTLRRDLNAESTSGDKLSIIRTLIETEGLADMLPALDKANCFAPQTAEYVAQCR